MVMKLQDLLPVCVYEYYFTVLTCDVETGPDDGAENENARNNEQGL